MHWLSACVDINPKDAVEIFPHVLGWVEVSTHQNSRQEINFNSSHLVLATTWGTSIYSDQRMEEGVHAFVSGVAVFIL